MRMVTLIFPEVQYVDLGFKALRSDELPDRARMAALSKMFRTVPRSS